MVFLRLRKAARTQGLAVTRSPRRQPRPGQAVRRAAAHAARHRGTGDRRARCGPHRARRGLRAPTAPAQGVRAGPGGRRPGRCAAGARSSWRASGWRRCPVRCPRWPGWPRPPGPGWPGSRAGRASAARSRRARCRTCCRAGAPSATRTPGRGGPGVGGGHAAGRARPRHLRHPHRGGRRQIGALVVAAWTPATCPPRRPRSRPWPRRSSWSAWNCGSAR